MSSASESHDKVMSDFIHEVANFDLADDATEVAMRNLEIFSKSRPPAPEPEPEPTPVPTTRWGKVKAGMSVVWDNETTRVLIKAGGAFAGVAVVAYSTIRRDHIIEKTALQQANQRPS